MMHARARPRTISSNLCYWAVLDGNLVARRGRGRARRRRQLGFLFESALPLPVDDLHAVFERLPGSPPRFVACGIEKSRLRNRTTGRDSVLTPSGVPTCIATDIGSAAETLADRLNLLTGPFEPPSVRRVRRAWLTTFSFLAMVIAVLVVIGAERRTRQRWDVQAQLNDQERHLYESALGPRATGSATSQPPALRLVAERRRLERTRGALPGVRQIPDVAGDLAGLLGQWPRELHARTESLTIMPGQITLTAHVASNEEAHELASALGRLPEWTLGQPRVTTTRDGVRAIVRLHPAPPEASP
ncbi:MAG: hypothetical protein KJO18_03715 [Acidimicrobiia bacterium]|nr:hypothetical protein [Acidimicrobiia bacterium]